METPRAIILVEGDSDRVALATLATRLGRDLAAERVSIVVMSGITNTRAFALRYGPRGVDVQLAGLYDAPDDAILRNGLAAAGFASVQQLEGPRNLGFFKCDADLEDELIRAHGLDGVEAVIESAGERRSLELLTQMPAQRGWTRTQVVRRFLGVRSGRKARYAGLLTEALPIERMPEPLVAVLDHVA